MSKVIKCNSESCKFCESGECARENISVSGAICDNYEIKEYKGDEYDW